METVQLEYDPERVSYKDLLAVFFSSHNPSRRSFRRQYASAIFYHNDDQKHLAEDAIRSLEHTLGVKVFTELIPYSDFTRAEDYHQKYFLRNQAELEKRFETIYPDPMQFTDSTAAARVNGYLGGYGSKEQFEREAPGLGLNEAEIRALEKLVWKWRKQGK